MPRPSKGEAIMAEITRELVEQCKQNLLETKAEILNRFQSARQDLHASDDSKGGDEGDQTMRALAESEFLSMNERLRKQLVEIESALARIHSGTYGICEETEEPIEAERLLAIPWTRLSIEGAEIRESIGKRYAR
ncbi:MAG: TraR/DksA family transcriptional regulator [Pseudobdellovibrionaceae bacterium]|nr:TraR/DksA family transcriptional regulator [Bdellovibrionales bacterium]USN47157.1 MAG: TraR/DksA family transcriptional regulator [Pseudobdellovibrionaceae bacterium]